ncbi:lysosomal aspartic protease-like [Cimex lectularius]|uniref:Peptidase A1 domain-containing protein n=1 Tax=Cimex lectularius TaxID=79782 RepID=A0A8I6TFT3_CIMLE|nr:lysosomal aspartic protease-like [Cimex lectularius]
MLCFALVFLTCTTCFAHSINDGVVSLSLERQDPIFITMLKQGIHPRVIETFFSSIKSQAGNGTVPAKLYKLFDNEYYGKLKIRKDSFNVAYDTAWGNTWVPSVNCSSASITCKFRNKYTGKNGTNTLQRFRFPIENTILTGTVWIDNLSFDMSTVKNQSFGVVDKIPFFPFIYSICDGVVGLASNSGMFKSKSIVTAMLEQGLIKKPIFSIYINRDPNTPKGGSVMFGGIDKKHYKGEFTYTHVLPQSNGIWMFKMQSITISPKFVLCQSGCNVYMDTGSNLISGPSAEIESINQYIGAQVFFLNRYTVKCGRVDQLPKVTFTIGGKKFTLKGPDYVQEVNFGPVKVCLTVFKKTEESDMWSLGGSFIASYYTTFDIQNQLIGFATSL